MSVDAVFLFRSDAPGLEASLRAAGYFARALVDGAVLVNSFMRFRAFERDRVAASAWLEALGATASLRRDPSGVLVFPDAAAPKGETYEAVVAEMVDAGFWLSWEPVPAEARQSHERALMADVEALAVLACRMATTPAPSIADLLQEDWPPVVREQLLQIQRLDALIDRPRPDEKRIKK
jgi:hypothetical protein